MLEQLFGSKLRAKVIGKNKMSYENNGRNLKQPSTHPFYHKPPASKKTFDFINDIGSDMGIRKYDEYQEERMWYENILDI